jgi:hypothetical protein
MGEDGESSQRHSLSFFVGGLVVRIYGAGIRIGEGKGREGMEGKV